MRVGIIGIGDICKKAYLPIITSKENVEIILCSRNASTLDEIKSKYRITESTTSIDKLLTKNIDCAFVHSSTASHFEICKKLLSSKIPVYVDKPISYTLEEATELTSLAKKNNTLLMVGFNRRFAPMVSSLKDLGKAHLVLIEKNRLNLPGEPRVFVYDDYIHVLDTLRFLIGGEYSSLTVDYLKDEAGLKNVVVKLSNNFTTGIGIMNRDNGITEENIEYMASGKKCVVKGLTSSILYENNTTTLKEFGDWENTLTKRGFSSIIEKFLSLSKNKVFIEDLANDFMKTHKLCEEVLNKIEVN
ncbi:MAG: Gfo/Idh/MocA family protein [Clostridium sp.]